MSAPYQAVILAAGRGSRLAEHTRETPKALLPIGPRSLQDRAETTFLRRQVELLREHGVRRIIVVVGTLRDMIEREVAGWDEPVDLVVNPTPDIGTSGSLHSFQFAARAGLGVLDGRSQTLLMDADIVYHRRALSTFLATREHSALMVSARFTGDDEEVLAYGTPERPRFLGKGLSGPLVDGAPCLGEATGVVKFAPGDHQLARTAMDWMLGDPGAPDGSGRRKGFGPARQATEHEELTQRLMQLGRMRAVVVSAKLPFMECDDAREYRLLRESFYPALLDAEAGEASA